MEIMKIEVEPRTVTGKRQIFRLREEGLVPAILYGQGRDPINLSVGERHLERHLRQRHRVFKLTMQGKEQAIYLQDVQYDCLTDRPLHIDFKRILIDRPIDLKVELVFIGHAVGISHGGHLVRDMMDLAVHSLPAAIPESVLVHVVDLDLGDAVVAADLELPDGVTLDVAPDTLICHVPLDIKPEPTEEVPPEGAEGAEAAGDKEPEKETS